MILSDARIEINFYQYCLSGNYSYCGRHIRASVDAKRLQINSVFTFLQHRLELSVLRTSLMFHIPIFLSYNPRSNRGFKTGKYNYVQN